MTAKNDRHGGWLPARGLLLHIGPHKTGTTTIQNQLAAGRRRLHRRGIVYPGLGAQHRLPALDVVDSSDSSSLPQRGTPWTDLVADVHAARRKRVVVSSE